nr:hypothetical protein [Erysipelothrix rhusiopathiae]
MFNFSLNIKTEAGRELIAPFSMSLNQNDRVALIGEEGNGKSLTIKALAQDASLKNSLRNEIGKQSFCCIWISKSRNDSG